MTTFMPKALVLSFLTLAANAGQLVVENKYPGPIQVVVLAANEVNEGAPVQVSENVPEYQTVKINFSNSRFPNLDTRFSAYGVINPPPAGSTAEPARVVQSNRVIVDVNKTSKVVFTQNANNGLDCMVMAVD